MANSPDINRGPAEQRASLPKTLERQIMTAVASKMAHADVEAAGVYDWIGFESTTASEIKARFPGNDELINEITAQVINTYIEADRHDF